MSVRMGFTARWRWYVWVSIAAVAAFVFLLSRDELTEAAWEQYRWPRVALVISRDAELAMQIGNYYFGGPAYDLAVAERAYRKAVAIEPGILWGHYQLARIHFMRREYEDALQKVALELEHNPENLRSLYIRGLMYAFRDQPGDLGRAEDDFRRFTQWVPKEWAGYNDLAWVLSKQGKYAEAKTAIEAAFREVPGDESNPWLWNSLGAAELNLGNYREATSAFKRAQDLAQGLSEASWRQAYPGNNPADAASGIQAFKDAIAENLQRAAAVNNFR